MYGRDGSPVGVIITESGSRRGRVHEGRWTGIMAYPMSPRALLPQVASCAPILCGSLFRYAGSEKKPSRRRRVIDFPSHSRAWKASLIRFAPNFDENPPCVVDRLVARICISLQESLRHASLPSLLPIHHHHPLSTPSLPPSILFHRHQQRVYWTATVV